MSQANLSRRLSAQDAAFLYFEREESPMHIGSVAVFQGQIPYDKFVKNIEDKIHLIPRYQQRIIPAPLNLSHPTWEWDPGFDIRRHIMPVRLDPPGDLDQLRALASRLFQGRLSRDKPLWELYLVHGIELLMILMDVSPNPPPPPPPPEPVAVGPIPDPISRFFNAMFDRMADNLRTTADVQKALLSAIDNPASARSVNRAL